MNASTSFKLNLKPAAAFANGPNEQNEVDAVTREAEAEERAMSTSSLRGGSTSSPPLTSKGPSLTTSPQQQHANSSRGTSQPSTVGDIPFAPFQLKKLNFGASAASDDEDNNGNHPSGNSSAKNRTLSSATNTTTTTTHNNDTVGSHHHVDPYSTKPPTLMLSRNGGGRTHTAHTSNSNGGSPNHTNNNTQYNNSTTFNGSNTDMPHTGTANGATVVMHDESNLSTDAAPPLQRKTTAANVRTSASVGSTASTANAAAGTTTMNTVPAFSLALNKLNLAGAGSRAGMGSGRGGNSGSGNRAMPPVVGGSSSAAAPPTPHFTQYNPEIERPVDVEEDDEFLTAVDDMPDDAAALKAELLAARRELLGWDIRFDAMRDHYHNHVAKLVDMVAHERHLHAADTHGVSYHHASSHHARENSINRSMESARDESPRFGGNNNTYGGNNTLDTTSHSSAGVSPRTRLIANPSSAIAATARGPMHVESAMQTDITMAVLEVMIKYPQSVRGERGNTRATSPAISAPRRNGTTTTTSKSRSPAASQPVTVAGRVARSPAAAPSTPTTRRSGALGIGATSLLSSSHGKASASSSKIERTGSDNQKSSTPMNRSILSTGHPNAVAAPSRIGSISNPNATNGAGTPSQSTTALHTSRARNSAVLSVNVHPATTPRAIVTARNRGVSPAVVSNASIGGTSSTTAGNTNTKASAVSSLAIPPSLSTAPYMKPGVRKFAGLTSTPTTGASTPSAGARPSSRLSATFDASGSHQHSEVTQLASGRKANSSTNGTPKVANLDASGGFGATLGGASGYEGSAVPSPSFAPRQIIKSNAISASSPSRYPKVDEHAPTRSRGADEN